MFPFFPSLFGSQLPPVYSAELLPPPSERRPQLLAPLMHQSYSDLAEPGWFRTLFLGGLPRRLQVYISNLTAHLSMLK